MCIAVRVCVRVCVCVCVCHGGGSKLACVEWCRVGGGGGVCGGEGGGGVVVVRTVTELA